MINKERLLITASTFPRWKDDKIPLFVYELALNLLDEYDVHVLAPHFKDAKVYEEMQGIKVHRFPYFIPNMEVLTYVGGSLDNIGQNRFKFLLLPFYLFFNFIWLIILNLKFKFKIVNVHWIVPTGLLVFLLKPLFNFKIIYTSHGGDVFGFKNSKYLKNIVTYCIGALLNQAEKLTVVSTDIKNEINTSFGELKGIEDKMEIIPMGINYNRFKDSQKRFFPQKPVRLLFIGRLAEKKGVEYLLKALRTLNDEGVDSILTIAGDGVLMPGLISLTKDLGLDNEVNFLGYVNNIDLNSLYREHDVLVGPSITAKKGDKEGLPVVYMEAMAAGMPIIATNTGGTSDLISNLENGLLIEEKNSIEIVRAVIYMIENIEVTQRLVDNAIKTAKEYDWDIVSASFSRVYRSLS